MVASADANAASKKHKRGRGVSTTNLINHIKDTADADAVHANAAAKVKEGSANFVTVEGEIVQKYTFSEAFPHHVDMLWLRGALSPHWPSAAPSGVMPLIIP